MWLLLMSLVAWNAYTAAAPAPLDSLRDDSDVLEPRPADLGVTSDRFTRGGCRLLAGEATTGRFPTGIAIVQIQVEADESSHGRRIRPLRQPDEQAVPWSECFDRLPVVREVVFPGLHGVPPDRSDLESMVRMAARLQCGLCLTFAASGDPVTDFRVLGVLWDAVEFRPLAAFDLSAEGDADRYRELLASEPLKAGRVRADWRATADFQNMVLLAAAELARLDRPVASTQPSPWINDRPLYPRDNMRRYGAPYWP